MTTQAEVRLATIDLSFHRAASGVVRSILARHGVPVVEIVAPHEKAFEYLRDGTADMLCSAWLPDSHGVYFAPMAEQFEKVTVLYRPYAYWGVPSYIPGDVVATIDDLRKPDAVAQMEKRIQGIGPGAGISRFSRTAVARYGLAELGYHFENGTLDECVGVFEEAVRLGKWVVVPLWEPQFLHEKHEIRRLEDPLGILGGADEATLVARHSLMRKLPDGAVRDLRNATIGNAEVSRLDYLISRDHLDPLDAALTLPCRVG
ncbi:glycine betaine ABC transporter substrate-binding protein [Burkholderia sp. F1]|uniref:glycine betaine ABC transporter substrate-binding protein n=1 Tax=Burkholderia sp. F1 TaxID=3366817 RepID=UPI003D736D21